MVKRYIISLMAANRVGILAAVTNALDELGGDLQEVSQTVMQKYFTIILAAEFPEHREPDVIVDHIRGICKPYGVEVNLKEPDLDILQDEPEEGTEKYFLTVAGTNKPGIMRSITVCLAGYSIDVTDLYAVGKEPDASFVMVMELSVPPGVDAPALKQELEDLGSSIGLSATLQHESLFAATNSPRPVRVAPHLSLGQSANLR